MKTNRLLTALTLLCATSSVFASTSVPSCYSEDNQQSPVQDGAYSIQVSTKNITATQYGLLLNKAQFGQPTYALISYVGDGSLVDGSTITMNLQAETSSQYTTLVGTRTSAVPWSTVKANTLAFLQTLSQMPGVTSVNCENVETATPLDN